MPRKPSFMIVITDQQSGNPYWPAAWEENNLPAMRWLKNHGINFRRAYTNSCTCSPARVTMLTGLYPAQHGVTEVLEFDNISRVYEDVTLPSDPDQSPTLNTQSLVLNIKERRQRGMPSNIQNLAKILKTAGYNVIFKGKRHLTKPANFVNSLNQKYWTEADVKQLAERYGFDGWSMPDAGDNLAIANMGGGTTQNDQRFINGHGQAAKYGDVPYDVLEKESVLHFLETYDSTSRSASSSPWSIPTTCSPIRDRARWRSTAFLSTRPAATRTASSCTCPSTGRRPGMRICRPSRAPSRSSAS
jgi:arylsulfatase A-like enzyme